MLLISAGPYEKNQGRSQVFKKGGPKKARVFVKQLKYKLNYP